MQDTKFKVPKSRIVLRIFTNDNGWNFLPNVYASVLVWKEMFINYMRELTYLAEMANLSFSMSIDENSISLWFSGFNSSMKNYCTEIFKKICEFKINNL